MSNMNILNKTRGIIRNNKEVHYPAKGIPGGIADSDLKYNVPKNLYAEYKPIFSNKSVNIPDEHGIHLSETLLTTADYIRVIFDGVEYICKVNYDADNNTWTYGELPNETSGVLEWNDYPFVLHVIAYGEDISYTTLAVKDYGEHSIQIEEMVLGHWLKNFIKWCFDSDAESGGGGGGGPIQLVPSISNIGYLEGWSLPSPGVIVIPDGTRGILSNAFNHCGGLVGVVIPSSVTSISDGAFAYCDNLDHVSLPDGLTSLGEMAFIECRSLSEIFIPGGVDTVKKKTFMYCARLSNVTIGGGIITISENAFDTCSSLSHVSLPSTLKSIGQQAFAKCTNLRDIYIPTSVVEGGIATDAFQYCAGLTEIRCGFAEGAVQGAPWGATNATVHYNV